MTDGRTDFARRQRTRHAEGRASKNRLNFNDFWKAAERDQQELSRFDVNPDRFTLG